jgi:cell division protein FtsB
MDLQSLLKTRWMTAALALVFAAVSFITVELYMQKREVDSEISRLQGQADSLNQDNQQLSELIQYLGTPEYQEKEAREKLNLKREGEQVVVLPESDEGLVAGANASQQTNPERWFNYFFGTP